MKMLLLVMVCLLGVFSVASAKKAEQGLYFSQDLGASYNPLGLLSTTRIFYSVPLIREEGVLWESTKIDFGIENLLSPAFEGASVFVKVEPIAVFNIKASYGYVVIYKALGFGFRPLNGYTDDFSDKALAAIPQQDQGGIYATIQPTFQIAVGNWMAANNFVLNYWNMPISTYFYDAYNDLIQNKTDLNWNNSTYLLYQLTPEIVVGLNNLVVGVPNTSQFKDRIAVMGAYSKVIDKNLDWYCVAMLGTFLSDPHYQYAIPYAAFQGGLTLKLF